MRRKDTMRGETVSGTPRDDVESWTETTSARERVRSVVETLREPRSTNWISEQADVSWSTANAELDALVDRGRVREVEAGDRTLYQPDYARLLFEEIRRLIEENTREELRAELTAIAEETEEWEETYGVETWEELEGTLADADLSSGDLRERRDAVAYWRENERDRRLLEHALALYSDVESARDRMTNPTDRAQG